MQNLLDGRRSMDCLLVGLRFLCVQVYGMISHIIILDR